MKRRGAGNGTGMGYRNLPNFPKDPIVHKMSGCGMKQPQRIPYFDVKIPPTMEMGSYTTKVTGSAFESKEKQALQDYNSAREHDNLPPVKRLPKGTKYEKGLTDKQQINRNYEKYIIDSIDAEDYGLKKLPQTPKEKLQFLKDTFRNEYGYMISRVGEQNAFKEWLMGLPSSINLPFMNYDILQFAKKMGSLPENATEKQEDRVLENYWNFMANKTFQAFRKYKVN